MTRVEERPAKCYGRTKHRRGCRKGRPLCRWRRSKPCGCGAYHYPHREGSGRCGNLEAMNLFIWGPSPAGPQHFAGAE